LFSKIAPWEIKRTPLILGEILLPLAGEGADRRMRVDQNISRSDYRYNIGIKHDNSNQHYYPL
jgi:hypothetical protein